MAWRNVMWKDLEKMITSFLSLATFVMVPNWYRANVHGGKKNQNLLLWIWWLWKYVSVLDKTRAIMDLLDTFINVPFHIDHCFQKGYGRHVNEQDHNGHMPIHIASLTANPHCMQVTFPHIFPDWVGTRTCKSGPYLCQPWWESTELDEIDNDSDNDHQNICV